MRTPRKSTNFKSLDAKNQNILLFNLSSKCPSSLRPVAGLLITVAGAFMFSSSNAGVKLLGRVDPFTCAVVRFAFITVMALPGVIYKK